MKKTRKIRNTKKLGGSTNRSNSSPAHDGTTLRELRNKINELINEYGENKTIGYMVNDDFFHIRSHIVTNVGHLGEVVILTSHRLIQIQPNMQQ